MKESIADDDNKFQIEQDLVRARLRQELKIR